MVSATVSGPPSASRSARVRTRKCVPKMSRTVMLDISTSSYGFSKASISSFVCSADFRRSRTLRNNLAIKGLAVPSSAILVTVQLGCSGLITMLDC
jgi:hypothetical protein